MLHNPPFGSKQRGLHNKMEARLATNPATQEKDTILEIDLVAQVHLSGDGREDEALLTTVREGKLDLTVQAAWPE